MEGGRYLALAAGMAAALQSSRANGDPGAVGRLQFRAGDQLATVADAEAAIGAELVLEARRARVVLRAELEPDGTFVFRGPPGRYRVEYVRAGDTAEFFAPHSFSIAPGADTCVGTLTLRVRTLEQLGANETNEAVAASGCPDTSVAAPSRQAPLARAPQYEHLHGLSYRDYVVRLRVETAWGPFVPLRAIYRHPVDELRSGLVLDLEAGMLFGDESARGYDLALAGGLRLWGMLDALAAVGYRTSDQSSVVSDGVILAARLRATNNLLGLGVVAEVLPEQAWFFTIDLVPLGLIGRLL